MRVLTGMAAVGFSTAYVASDLIEITQGGFSTGQLLLTYAAEAALPLFVLGIFAVQRPLIGRLGLFGAVLYAYTYVFFTSTVIYCLIEQTPDWETLAQIMGPWITVHGVLMVLAGSCLGVAVARAGVLPAWTGYLLIAGVWLVALTNELPDGLRVTAATVRAAAFIAMGVAILRLTPAGRGESRPEAAVRSV